MKRVILVSGGIDSTIAWHFYSTMRQADENIPVFIAYDQEYMKEERAALLQLDIPNVQEMRIDIDPGLDVFVPARNLTFASAVASAYDPDEIVIAGLRDDVVVDKTPEAFTEMSNIISKFSKKQIKVISPFWGKSKGEIVGEFLQWHKSADLIIRECFSCYSPVDHWHCGNCPACFRRYVAMVTNGIPADFDNKALIIEYLDKIHRYDSDRQSRIFTAAKMGFQSLEAFDIDGILTIETDGHNYASRTLNSEWKDKINEAYRSDSLVVLYTARYEYDRKVTKEWLRKHGILYHSLIMGKVPYDTLIDDRSYHVILESGT